MNSKAIVRSLPSRLTLLLVLALLILGLAFALVRPETVLAEGSGQFGLNQTLDGGYSNAFTFYVNILTAGEVINVSLDTGSFSIYDPLGNLEVSNQSGGQVLSTDPFNAPITTAYKFTTDQAGTWRVVLADTTYYRFDITVTPSTAVDPDPRVAGGRLFAYDWGFTGQGGGNCYQEVDSTDGDYYNLVPGGRPETNYVWRLDLNNFAGCTYNIIANDLGVDPPYSGYSVPSSGNNMTPKWPMYLGYPAIADPEPTLPPVVSSLRFVDDQGVDMTITPPPTTPGVQDTGWFSFTSDVTGTYALTIDTNRDNIFGGGDKLLLGNVSPGGNQILWDGTDPDDNYVATGVYSVQVQIRMGEYHFIAEDAETSGGTEDGLTICKMPSAGGAVTDTLVFWDDLTYLAGTTTLPNGEICSISAGHHTWGDYTSGGFGNNTYIDSYVYGLSTVVQVQAIIADDDTPVYVPEVDLDADDSSGITGADHEIWFVPGGGPMAIADTDTTITDTDSISVTKAEVTLTTPQSGDVLTLTVGSLPAGITLHASSTDHYLLLTGLATLADYETAIELVSFNNPSPTPPSTRRTVAVAVADDLSYGNTAISTVYLEGDDDGDGIPNSEEGSGDTDDDGHPDYQDPDDDGDGVGTAYECPGGLPCGDSDGDGTPDYLDDDDDDDGIPTADEDADPNGDGDPSDAVDTDGDGTPDYLDDDSDDDGLIDGNEGTGDTDGDGAPDFQDDDDDGDGIPTADEGADPNGDGDPSDAVDTDGDGTPDYLDADDDNDGIPTSVEVANAPPGGDTDGDGIPDHLDLDSDNDGINDVHEGGGTDADGDGMHDGTPGELTDPPDTDGDGQPDYVDLDSDNDSISDLIEGGSGATDADDDGVADGPDTDGDGIVDSADGDDGTFGDAGDPGPQNTDGTDNPDYIDLDSDNDGTDDIDDAGNGDLDGNDDGQIDDDTDADNDGIPDNVDDDDVNFGGLGAPVSGQAPQAEDDAYTVPEGVASTLTVLDNDSDPDGDTITITQVTVPQHGVVSIVTTSGTLKIGALVYTPTAGYLGTDTFTYTVSDVSQESTAQVTVTVLPVADLSVSQDVQETLGLTIFTLVARNLGTRPADGAVISDTFPAAILNINWTCEAANGATCTASGSGNVLSDTLTSFPAGGVVTYTVTGSAPLDEVVYNTVSVMPPAGVFDLNMANNYATKPTRYRIILVPVYRNYSH